MRYQEKHRPQIAYFFSSTLKIMCEVPEPRLIVIDVHVKLNEAYIPQQICMFEITLPPKCAKI